MYSFSNRIAQKLAKTSMNWVVASNIAERIKDLRQALGGGRRLLQSDLATRAGVRTSQVSQWERGAQQPSRSRLERWAEREGWPHSIFEEGAPLPSEVLGKSQGRPSTEDPDAVLARFYQVMAEAAASGQPAPAELGVLMQALHELATASQEAAAKPSPKASPQSEVPSW